jgi:hypothetical protein
MMIEGSSIHWGFPISLNFCAQVGEQEGFRPTENSERLFSIERDWNLWWGSLVAFEDEVFRRYTLPAKPPTAIQNEQLARMGQARFDPPHFKSLASRPALRGKCRTYWRGFHKQWDEMQRQFSDNLLAQDYRLPPLGEVVAQDAISSEQGLLQPSILRVTFVLWPRDYYLPLSHEHIILGVQYLEPDQVTAFADIIRLHWT